MKQTICLLIFICISHFNFARYCEVPTPKADKLIEYYRNLFVDSASSTVSVNYFTSFYGNSESNVFGKSVMIGTDYYVIGTNGIQATLTRLNSLGSEIWTAVVSDTSSWADLIVTSNNNILLVGSVDIDLVTGTTGARNLLVGVCNTNGTFLSLQSSNYNEQESFTRILFNPNPANSNFPYYATGNVAGTSIDKVFVSTISNSGSIGSRFEFDSGNDDEFYQDIVLLNNAGDFALIGNRNTTGYIARVDKNLDPIDDGFLMDNYSSVFSLYALSSNPSDFQYIIAGTNASSKGIIGLFNGTTENSKIFTANGLSKVYNIVHGSGNEYYALGLGSVGGVSRTVVIKFEYNSGSLIFHWVRSINTATTPQVGGKIVIDAVPSQLIFSCGLLNPSGGSGSYEGLFSVQNLEFNNCNFENILIDFEEGNVTFSTIAISSQSMQINLSVNKNSQFIGLNSQYICEVIPSCEVDFAFANQSCGDVVFQSSTNIGGSISYCWDFGDNPPCGSTAPTIIHNYNNNGTYNVCLTVNNGLASCKICKQITINNSDHEKPIIVCPGTYTVDFCTNLPSPQVSGYPQVTDNLDSNPNIFYNDILTQTSSCQRLYTREWTAIDNCGNSVKCQQKIILKDLLLPYISCPADITIQCFQSADTTLTGGPKYHDYCRPAPSLSIKNDTILHNICTTEIKRSFIVVDACNNRDTCIQKIFVVDKTPPQILCAGTNLNPIECTSSPNFVQPTILSNQCGGKVAITHVDSRSTIGCSTTVQRIFTVTDQCGNSTTCVQEIRMVDTKPPLITNCGRKIEVQGINQTNGSCAATVQIIAPTATDNCGTVGLINSYNNTPDASGIYPVGQTIIVWTATDQCGLKSICIDTVLVLPCIPGCDTCTSLTINVEPSRDPNDSCCYNIDISNLCADGYFDKVELCSQDPSVVFGNQTLNPAWNYCSSTSTTTTCFEHNSGHIPVGTHQDVLKFCVDTQTNFVDTVCWRKVVGGEKHTLAIDNLGRLWGWGGNQEGQLGNSIALNYPYPILIDGSTTWKDITAGAQHSIALKYNGTLWACGQNNYGQLGISPSGNVTALTDISNGQVWKAVSTGDRHTIALDMNSYLFAWGNDDSEQLGNGPLGSNASPSQIGAHTWSSIEAGIVHNLAIRNDGTLWAWGENDGGQVGDLTFLDKNIPTQILSTYNDFTKISAGYVSFALRSNNELWGWGANSYSQLGNNNSVWTNTPAIITNPASLNSIIDFYSGRLHSILLDNAGNVYGAGYNLSNQLCVNNPIPGPYNDRTLTWIPTGITGVTQIFQGYDHNFAMITGNQLIGWGFNHHGNLNIGTLTYSECNQNVDCLNEYNSNPATPPPYNFELKFYHDGEVACDKMFDVDCIPDTLNACLDVSSITTECLYEQNKYKLTFTVSNVSNPAFSASSVIVNSPNTNISFSPSIIDFNPDINSGESQTVMSCIMTSPFPFSSSVALLQFQLVSADGRTICTEAEQHRVVLDECPKPCGYTCCEDGTPEDFESKPLGPLTTFQNGYVKSQGTVDVVQGGCDQSAKSILLNGGAKGLQPGIVSLVKGGVVGPIDFVKKDSMYCIKLCAYVPSFQTSPYDAKIGISIGGLPFSVPVGQITIPLSTNGWHEYSVTFTSPITTDIVHFSNASPAPVDAPTSIQFDNICFGSSRPVFDDPIPPVLNCPSDLTIPDTDQDCIIPYTIPSISITDNYGIASTFVYLDGTITSIGSTHNLSNSLVHEIKYVAEDFCGNKDSCSYQIYINCLMSGDSCYCGGFSDVYFFNQNFTTPVRCNERGLIWLDCPEDQKVFYIHGDLACTESCDAHVKYNVIDAQSNQLITSGYVSTNGTANHWDIPLDYSDFLQNKPFVIQVVGHCGSDSCICQVLFSIKTCDSVCCQGPKAFEKIVKDAITISVNDFLCKATINIADLPHSCNIKVKTINWKDGTIVNGPFAPGSMVMHTYNSPNVGYIVEVIVNEFDDQGKLCNEYKLKLPISLNCVECCRKSDYKIFTNLVNQGFVVNVQDCQVTVTSPQFGSCVFFESIPNFGAGSVPVLMQIPASGSWTYNYLNSGTYTICVQVSEYPNGDITQKPCRTKLMCTPVTVNCSDTCTCAGFNNLMFYYDKKKKLSVECSDTVKLECPPDDCVWTFTGNLLCKNNCQSSDVSWSLVNSISGLELASGSTVAYPAFGISVPPGIITMGGEFDLILNGSCGNQEVCNCVIHIVAPGCDSSCNCNIDDFLNDVNMGIGPVTIFDDCLGCFSPKALTQCDQVEWYLLPSNRLILSSVGSQLVCYRFGNLEEYVLRMVVKRKNHDGSICEEAEKLVVIQPNCSTLFDHYFDNQLCNVSSGSWNSISSFSVDHLTNITLESRIDENRLTLNGNLSESGKLISDEFCVNNGILSFELLLSATKFQALKTGTRLLVEFVPTAALDPAIKSSTSGSLKSEVLIPETFSSDFIIKGELLLDLMSDQSHCDKDQILGRLIISLSNLLPGDLINPNSSVHLEKVCISQSVSQNISSIPSNSVVVFPNPSSGFFKILAKNYESSFSKLEIYYASGGLVKAVEWDHFKRQFSFEEALPRGVYILKVKTRFGMRTLKVVCN
ncbi:MAG TPA: PKD domain-containing protein [Saprospiraceae bacterium]|nr:PKD domain-containing protein [Saprospiraceae bacterium]